MSCATTDFEAIAWVYSPSDLAILLSLLEGEDIFVTTSGRGHASVALGLTTALGGVALRVHRDDAEDARALLAALDPALYRARLPFGSWPLDLLLFLFLAFLGAPPPPRQIPTYVVARVSTT